MVVLLVWNILFKPKSGKLGSGPDRPMLAQVQGTGVPGIVHRAGTVLVDCSLTRYRPIQVEHNGGNDLVDVQVGFEEADRPPDAAHDGSHQQAHEPGQLEHDGTVQRTVGAQRYRPAAPMLNRPVLKANATDRPVMISGAALARTLPTPYGASKKPPSRMRTKPSPHAWDGLMASSTR